MTEQRQAWLAGVAFALLAAVATVVFFVSSDQRGKTRRLQADAAYYYHYLPSLLRDRDLDFRDEYRHIDGIEEIQDQIAQMGVPVFLSTQLK